MIGGVPIIDELGGDDQVIGDDSDPVIGQDYEPDEEPAANELDDVQPELGDEDQPRRLQAPVPDSPRPVRHGRYEPLETVPMRGTMPRIYRRNVFVRFWYIPAALLLGAGVAVGVVAGSDYLSGNDAGPGATLPTATPQPSPSAAPTATVQAGASPAPSPNGTASDVGQTRTPAAGSTVTTPPGSSSFSPQDRAVVTGTGDCLRVRDAPTTSGSLLSCLPDGTEAAIISGPAEANGFRWWLIRAEGVAEGWVVENYLTRR